MKFTSEQLPIFFAVFLVAIIGLNSGVSKASEYNKPWQNKQRAIVLDAYEKNHIDWMQVVKNKQIRAFIGKASDGLQSPYACPGNETEKTICKKSFQNYFMKQQLYHTRRALAKTLGLKWGAYHLGRPGNPIAQADHFINFAKPESDELIALDIEHDNPEKWISFADAEIFAKRIYSRIGRYPVLYTNHDTAKRIAARRAEFPILSRLPLWYARYRSSLNNVFPMGHWDTFALWQFSSGVNCGKRRCLYRVKGAPTNIDVNVSSLTIAEFDKAWPFNNLVPERKELEENGDILWVKNEELEDPSEDKLDVQLASLTTEVDGDQIEQSITTHEELGVSEIAIPQISPRRVASLSVNTLASPVAAANANTIPTPEKAKYGMKVTPSSDLNLQLQYLSGAL